MSVHVIKWAFALSLQATEKYVLVALADYADEHGECWPSQVALADKCGLSERAVRNNIHTLIEKGLVKMIERRDKEGKRRVSKYVLQFKQPASDDIKPPEHDDISPDINRHITTEEPAACSGIVNEEPSLTATVTSVTDVTHHAPSADKPAGKVVKINPVRLIDGRFEIEPDVYERFEQTFPGIELEAELAKAELWLDANQTRRKKNLKAFLVNWLGRSQSAIDQATARGRAFRGGR